MIFKFLNEMQEGVDDPAGKIMGNTPPSDSIWKPDEDGSGRLRTVNVLTKDSGTNRDWHRDNNCEGEFELILDRFPDENEILAQLKGANTDKVGAPFEVPDCVIEWGMKQIVGHRMGYRSVAAKISYEMNRMGLPGISYSQLNKRASRLKIHKGTTDVTDARVMAFGRGEAPSRSHHRRYRFHRPVPGQAFGMDGVSLEPDRSTRMV